MKEMTDTAPAAANSNLPELTVSELAQAVKRTMETNFDRVRVRGERSDIGQVEFAVDLRLRRDEAHQPAASQRNPRQARMAQIRRFRQVALDQRQRRQSCAASA